MQTGHAGAKHLRGPPRLGGFLPPRVPGLSAVFVAFKSSDFRTRVSRNCRIRSRAGDLDIDRLVEISVDAEKGKALSVLEQHGSADHIGEHFAIACHEIPGGQAHVENRSTSPTGRMLEWIEDRLPPRPPVSSPYPLLAPTKCLGAQIRTESRAHFHKTAPPSTPAGGEISLCGARLAYTHTSVLLEELVAKAPDGPVDLDWLLGYLDKRSFGFLLLLLGLLVIVPGVASIASLMVSSRASR